MDFTSFVEGPLLRVVFVCFFLAMATRMIFFLSTIFRGNRTKSRILHGLSIIFGALLPYHRDALQNPIYSLPRYVFHLCLFVVPVWFSGHIVLWEESRLGWSWTPLPDRLADWITLLLLGLAAFFLARRLLVPTVRKETTTSNYLLIGAAVLPPMTGYFLAHGTLDAIPFFADHMKVLHVIAGEAFLVTVIFLFYRTELLVDKCTGCGSCVVACPTKTLISKDEGRFRRFSYLHYQCICCGACVHVCPEQAAALRHEIGPKRLLKHMSEEIRAVSLLVCIHCGAQYAPESQLEKIHRRIHDDFIYICPNCRMIDYGERVRKTVGQLRFPPPSHPIR